MWYWESRVKVPKLIHLALYNLFAVDSMTAVPPTLNAFQHAAVNLAHASSLNIVTAPSQTAKS